MHLVGILKKCLTFAIIFTVPSFSFVSFDSFNDTSKFLIVLRNRVMTHFPQVRTVVQSCLCCSYMSLHKKSCLCSFRRNQYAVNWLIRLWVRMCFCNQVPIFCDTVLMAPFWSFPLMTVFGLDAFTALKYTTFFIQRHKVSQLGHAALSEYTETSVICRDHLLI